jgi:putative transposase
MVPLSHRARDNRRLPRHIKRIHDGSDGVVGSPRIWEELRYGGEPCGHNRVARLMRHQGLYGVPQRKRWRKKVSGQQPGDVHNHL